MTALRLPAPLLKGPRTRLTAMRRAEQSTRSTAAVACRAGPLGSNRSRSFPPNEIKFSRFFKYLLTCLPQACYVKWLWIEPMQMTRGDATQHCHRLADQDRRPRRRSWSIPSVRYAAGSSYPRLPPPPPPRELASASGPGFHRKNFISRGLTNGEESPPTFQTEKQLTAPADRRVRDPAHAGAFTTAVARAIGGAGSVHRRTGIKIKTARTLPVDSGGARFPAATNCAQYPPPAWAAMQTHCCSDHRHAWRRNADPDVDLEKGGSHGTQRTARARGVSRGELRAWFPLTR